MDSGAPSSFAEFNEALERYAVSRDSIGLRATLDGLQHMGRDLGILTPVEFAITCEAKQDLFRQERNALICGASLFLYFVLGRWPKK